MAKVKVFVTDRGTDGGTDRRMRFNPTLSREQGTKTTSTCPRIPFWWYQVEYGKEMKSPYSSIRLSSSSSLSAASSTLSVSWIRLLLFSFPSGFSWAGMMQVLNTDKLIFCLEKIYTCISHHSNKFCKTFLDFFNKLQYLWKMYFYQFWLKSKVISSYSDGNPDTKFRPFIWKYAKKSMKNGFWVQDNTNNSKKSWSTIAKVKLDVYNSRLEYLVPISHISKHNKCKSAKTELKNGSFMHSWLRAGNLKILYCYNPHSKSAASIIALFALNDNIKRPFHSMTQLFL